MRNKLIVFTIIIILLSSCSFIDDKDKNNEIIEHPDLVLFDTTYSINRGSNDPIKLEATKIEIYNKKNLTIAENAKFEIINQKGDTQVEGSCDKLEIYTKNNNIELFGNVNFSINNPQLQISCDKLSWNDKEQLINTEDENIIVNSYIGKFEGSGLSANINERYFEFKRITKGEIYEK